MTLTFTAKVDEEKHFSFTDLKITDSTISIGDYVTPAIVIQYSDLKILL